MLPTTLARSLSQSPIESHAIIKVALGRLRLGPRARPSPLATAAAPEGMVCFPCRRLAARGLSGVGGGNASVSRGFVASTSSAAEP